MSLKLKRWGIIFDIDNLNNKIHLIEEQLSNVENCNDIHLTKNLSIELKICKNKLNDFEKLKNQFDDLIIFIDISLQENDDSVLVEINELYKNFVDTYEALKISTLLSGKYDKNNAILSLHAGAGGTEACDWVNMLFRMFSRYSESMNFKLDVLDYLDGDEAGIKNITILITGINAYGYLKSEKGVHRLVRISPFDSSGKRHTSFASCDVMPEIDDDIEIVILDDEIKIDTFRASGAGGQHVNKTESAIRITHIPTNTIVSCQKERSQHKNKDIAMKMLKSKLFEIKRKEQESNLNNIRGKLKDISWGNQIRSYVFHPYSLVKDHRTNCEISNITSVMDGNIINFVNAYLNWILSDL